MKKTLLSLVFFGLCMTASASAQDSSAISSAKDSSATALTLEKSVSIALKNATSVQKAKNNLDLSGAQLLQSYGQFLPNLGISSRFSYRAPAPQVIQAPTGEFVTVLIESEQLSYGISSSLNLFNGLSDYAGLQSALRSRDAAGFSLTRAKQQIAFDIAQAYLQVLLDQEIVGIDTQNLSSQQEQLRQLREQTRVGARAIADLYQQEAVVSAAELTLIRDQNKLRNDQTLLVRRLRIDMTKNYSFATPTLDTLALGQEYQDVNLLIKSAIESRVDLKSSQLNLEANDFRIMQSFAGYLPRLDFGFDVNSFRQQNGTEFGQLYQDLTRQQAAVSLSLNLNWTIFDRFSTNLGIQQAKINYLNSKLDYEDLQFQVIGEVRQSFGEYNAAISQLESTRRGLISAERAFETVQRRYDVGSANFVELQTARTALVQAQSNRAQAVFNFTFQKRILEYYLGTISIDTY